MNEQSFFNTPILFIPYDRPAIAKKAFSTILKIKPIKLYVFVDGPNEKRNNSKEIEINKKLLDSIDWPCTVLTNFQISNLGAGRSVAEAITWVFKNEESAIIIEEDCVPTLSFFTFCDKLLEKYKDDNRICMISGNNYTEEKNAVEESYFFSKYGHIWGWATWRRAWAGYDFEMKDWPIFKDSNQLNNIFSTKKEQNYYLNYFNKFYLKEEKNTWDCQWLYCRLKNYGLSIVPKSNLVTNIGIQGANTIEINKAHFRKVSEDFNISKEPKFILCNAYYDKNHFKLWISKRKPIIIRMIRKILKFITKQQWIKKN